MLGDKKEECQWVVMDILNLAHVQPHHCSACVQPCFPFIPQPRPPILILLSMLRPSHNATPLLSSTQPTNPTPNPPLPSTEKFPVAYIEQ